GEMVSGLKSVISEETSRIVPSVCRTAGFSDPLFPKRNNFKDVPPEPYVLNQATVRREARVSTAERRRPPNVPPLALPTAAGNWSPLAPDIRTGRMHQGVFIGEAWCAVTRQQKGAVEIDESCALRQQH